MTQPVFRFAPSPNGHLHLGHALSALLNARAAVALSGRFLVRVEDIDQTRCTPDLEREMFEDLAWLGVPLDEPCCANRKFPQYRAALEKLQDMGLVYPAYLTRAEIKAFVSAKEANGESWPRDPDGAPLYPGDAAVLSAEELRSRAASDAPFSLRLDMQRALAQIGRRCRGRKRGGRRKPVCRTCRGACRGGSVGDVILARKDTPTSYHLSVVVDDARQGITDVLRGQDLYHATSVHRVLQELLGLPSPVYRHHRLVLGADGRKLSKSSKDTSLRSLREAA